MKKLLLSLCLILTGTGLAVAQTGYYIVPHTYGPGNPGGYNTDDEYPSGGGMISGWSILAGGSQRTPQWSGVQNVPFSFKFNNTNAFQYKVSTAGVVTFDVSSTLNPAYGQVTLPSATIPNTSIVVTGGSAQQANDYVVTKTFGPAGRQQLWIQFNSYTSLSDTLCWTYWAIVLEEGTNNIYIVDQRVGCANAITMSIGVQIDANTAVAPAGPVTALAGNVAGAAGNHFYAFMPGTRPALGVKFATLDIPGFGYAGVGTTITGKVVNTGSTAITSATLNYKVGTAATVSTNLTGQNIATNAMQAVNHPTVWTPAAPGTFDIKVWLSNINGGGTNSDTVSKSIAVIGAVIDNLVVFEHFTNASCGPCAAQNPAFTAVLNNNRSKATSVKYHVSWPGVDPMYSLNPTDPTARVNYYNVTGVPAVRLSNTAGWGPTGVTQAVIDQYAASLPNAWDYTINTSLSGSTLTVTGNVKRKSTLTASDYALHVLVVEDPVIYATPPGTNGETDFPSTVRKMLPDASGTNLGAGATATPINLTYNIPAGIKTENLHVVVFVQSVGSKNAFKGVKIKAGAGIVASTSEIEANTNRSSVYPNPVNAIAKLEIEMQNATQVNVSVRNMLGQVVKTMELGRLETGRQFIDLDMTELTNGMYLIQVEMGGETHTHRLVKN